MKRLEIIHLRSSREPVESLGERIRKSIRSGGADAEAVTLYRRDGLKTDLAVHIDLPGAPAAEGASALGLRLASALKAFGLVEHTLWKELR